MEQYVSTLIASPGTPLEQSLIDHISATLQGEGAIINACSWLSKGIACDITFAGLAPAIALQHISAILGKRPIDKILQTTQYRRKKLLISDMDSTIINQECIDELADYAGCKAHIATITERAMNGELDFKDALRERVALLAGLPESVLEQTFRERITLMKGALELVATMNKAGAATVLVSGGFTFFTSKVAALAGFVAQEANILAVLNGKLTGKVIEPILDKEAKLRSLEHYRQYYHLRPEETLAVGDGANDLPMIQAAGLGVAYHAKPRVRAEAKAQVNFTDLKTLLYIQGYTDAEIVLPG